MSQEPTAQCDCCGRILPLYRVWAFGNLETWACGECCDQENEERPADYAMNDYELWIEAGKP